MAVGERQPISEGADVRLAADAAPRGGRAAARPMALAPNRLERFYSRERRIDELRGHPVNASGGPEDWVGSTTSSFGDHSEGLSRLADGRVLCQVIGSDPVGFLAAEHVAGLGASPALLVKPLDAGERLPVHFHPGRAFARETLGLSFGKTEAWITVTADADADAVVHLGLGTSVPASTVARWVCEQDVAAMLSAMREASVSAGQVFFVPAGTLHAVGAGILLVELPEPTDLSVLLEWRRFGASSGVEHLRLGCERALAALDLSATTPERLLVRASDAALADQVRKLLSEVAAPYFPAQRIVTGGGTVQLDQSFAIIVVLDRCLQPAADAEVGEW